MRSWLLKVLDRGGVADIDPDEVVEVVDAPLVRGPMLVALLKREGIESKGVESYDVVTGVRSRMRIMVRRADKEAAERLLDGT
jgi:hypothetical protein